MLSELKNEEIILTYQRAVELELDQAFIDLLENEIKQRGLAITESSGVGQQRGGE